MQLKRRRKGFHQRPIYSPGSLTVSRRPSSGIEVPPASNDVTRRISLTHQAFDITRTHAPSPKVSSALSAVPIKSFAKLNVQVVRGISSGGIQSSGFSRSGIGTTFGTTFGGPLFLRLSKANQVPRSTSLGPYDCTSKRTCNRWRCGKWRIASSAGNNIFLPPKLANVLPWLASTYFG
jgi:hypothetical protein